MRNEDSSNHLGNMEWHVYSLKVTMLRLLMKQSLTRSQIQSIQPTREGWRWEEGICHRKYPVYSQDWPGASSFCLKPNLGRSRSYCLLINHHVALELQKICLLLNCTETRQRNCNEKGKGIGFLFNRSNHCATESVRVHGTPGQKTPKVNGAKGSASWPENVLPLSQVNVTTSTGVLVSNTQMRLKGTLNCT